MLVVHASSGDPAADRRYAYAQGALGEGDAAAAADLAAQALAIAPGFAPAWVLLGQAREALGAETDAREAYRTARDLDPGDRLGAGLALARLGEGAPDGLPPAYLRALFDAYAPGFERHLVGTLGYRGPAVVRAALEAVRGTPLPPFARVLDLGCGTGLMAAALADATGTIVGVDISPAMLAQARRTGRYARLVEGDLVAALAAEPPGSADLVVAADAVPYLGALGPLLRAAARTLAPEGLLAFTAQTHAGEGVVLGTDTRFAHAAPAIRAEAEAAGFAVRHLADAWVRRENEAEVPGLVAVLARGAGP